MTPRHTDPFATISLARLRVFDAVARNKTMVRAATELGITQGAVSRHIKSLEDQLGTLLLQRGPRGIALTEAGDLLADHVRRAFDQLASGLQRLGQPRRRTTLVVIAPRSFALRVLAPRIADFVARNPWIDLRVDTHRYYTDFERSPGDVAIRAGDGRWDDFSVERLTQDSVLPVCAPGLWPHGEPGSPTAEFLRNNVLLHYAERPYWDAWLSAAALDRRLGQTGPSFSETALALAAAEGGQGIAIGRCSLVADALAEGRLVRPFSLEIDDGVSYFLVLRRNDVTKPMVRLFSDWLRQEMGVLAETCARLRRPRV
jgi:LysR family glycine cleavage system transcriptional activator